MPAVRGGSADTLAPVASGHQDRQKGAYGRTACDFCRKRKIKCDGESPCSACVRLNHSATCKVTEQVKRDQNTSKELEDAHEQIKILQARISASAENSRKQYVDLQSEQTSLIGTPQNDISPASAFSQGSGGNYEHSEEARQARYHGPTSASFHDIQSEAQDQTNSSTLTPFNGTAPYAGRALTTQGIKTSNQPSKTLPSDEYLSPIVTAHAAHQQQAEMTNVLAGRLDFDGIEPELTMHLLSLHWNRQHHAFLVTYRPLFMRDMAAGSTGRYFSKLLLHAILFGASKFSDRIEQVRTDVNDPSSAGARFFRRIEVLLPEALMTSRITTVQALLLLACTHFARGAESAAWLHSGLAFRMAADLGLFVHDGKEQVAADELAPEEMELRRRVAWAAYTIDKIHSLYQGRQVSIRLADVGVPAAFIDKFEEQEYWTPIAYQGRAKAGAFACPVFSVSTFTQLCKLTMILEEIIESFYGVKSARKARATLLEDLQGLHEKLKAWHADLPGHLAMILRERSPLGDSAIVFVEGKDGKSPNVISIHALYQCLVLLLYRPFLPYGHLYEQVNDAHEVNEDDHVGLSAVARLAWKVCVDAAWQISHLMSLYRSSVTMKGAPQLISYINLCGTGILVRLAAQVGRHSDDAQKRTAQAALHAIQACLKDFEENEHPNPGVAKANTVIRRMARYFGIDVDAVESTSTASMPNAMHNLQNVNVEVQDTVQDNFDLDSFLSTFDNLNDLGNLMNPADNSLIGADVMFGFLKDTQV